MGAFATSSGPDYAIDLRDPSTGAIVHRLPGPKRAINAMAFDASGLLLVAATTDGDVFIWNTKTGAAVQNWRGLSRVVGVGFVGNGANIVTAEIVGRVAIRNVATGDSLRETAIPTQLIRMTVAPREDSLIAAGEDGSLHFLRLPDLNVLAIVNRAHEGRIASEMVFSPDGRLFITTGVDRRVIIWDAQTRQPICSLLREKADVHNLAIDSDGSHLALGSAEESIAVWNLGLIRGELAAIGLDWDSQLPTGTVHADALASSPPPPVRVVRVPLLPVGLPAPTDDEALLAKLFREGRYEEVITAAENAIKANPSTKSLYLTLGDGCYQLAQYEKAIEALEGHLNLCPNCQAALLRLAVCHEASGEADKAVEMIERLVQEAPNQPAPANLLARFYTIGPERVRNPEKALIQAQRALALAPTNLQFLITQGMAYYRSDKLDSAIETLQAALKGKLSKQQAAMAQLFLAMSYQRQGDADKAKECFRKAPRLSSADQVAPHLVKKSEEIRAEAADLLGLK
jgi:tetratricopeptide (TPR) repeat protein